jgi:hypothetical protein
VGSVERDFSDRLRRERRRGLGDRAGEGIEREGVDGRLDRAAREAWCTDGDSMITDGEEAAEPLVSLSVRRAKGMS